MESTVSSPVESFILNTLRSMACEPDDVTREASLESLDVDSLDLVELTQLLEEEVGVTTELRGVETVADVVDRCVAASS